ncbi:rRNA methyltransferase 1, mitochondrial [Hoplias malabaricus]|uniref:rRNA methyltransferase 1, mitochondrial n=1 Tax=Hoplias malabaricus TaxID=27720 RepID=UPI003462C87D
MWRTVCRCSFMFGNIRNNVYSPKEELSAFFCSAPYQSIKSHLISKYTGFKLAKHLRCHFSTSFANPARTHGFRSSRRSHKEPNTSHPERRVSSELQKLSLEDFTKAEAQRHFHKVKQNLKTGPDHLKGAKELEVVFGVAPCFLALSLARRKLSRLFVKDTKGHQREAVQRIWDEAVRHGVPIQKVSKRELDKMTGGMVHQGVCLQASSLDFVTEEKSTKSQHGSDHQHPLWLVLDGVQDPMNLGSILRSAYFLGVDRVVSSIRNSCPLTPVVSKASSGVMEIMEVYGYSNLTDFIKMKLDQGWQVIGTVGSEEVSEAAVVPCSDFRISKPTLLLMGGEGSGLSPELRQMCDSLLNIPPRRDLHPAVDSLNVSVATGIILHSLLSSRRAAG